MSTKASRRSAIRLATLLLGVGVLHFVRPEPFDGIVPRALPGVARTYTYASGVAEIDVAGANAVPRTRSIGGALAAALVLAVVPATLHIPVTSLPRYQLSSS